VLHAHYTLPKKKKKKKNSGRRDFFFFFAFSKKNLHNYNMLAKTVEINWHDGKAIYSVDFSPDGARYATAGADNTVRVNSIAFFFS
jgi:WD40 repeat protein